MDLMKELITTKPIETVEVVEAADSADLSRFQKIWSIVERELEHLNGLTKDASNFAKLVEKLGGDPATLDEAREHLAKFDDAMMDIHMSIGLKQEPHYKDQE